MSAEINTKMTNHTVVQFWGGNERGVCLQITASAPLKVQDTILEQLQEEGFIQLTMEEAAALCNNLGSFIKREATRRQELLRKEIARLNITEKTVFHEVANLSMDLIVGPELAIQMISQFCPKAPVTVVNDSEEKEK